MAAGAGTIALKLVFLPAGDPRGSRLEVDSGMTWHSFVRMLEARFPMPKGLVARIQGRPEHLPADATLAALGLVDGSVVEVVRLMD